MPSITNNIYSKDSEESIDSSDVYIPNIPKRIVLPKEINNRIMKKTNKVLLPSFDNSIYRNKKRTYLPVVTPRRRIVNVRKRTPLKKYNRIKPRRNVQNYFKRSIISY